MQIFLFPKRKMLLLKDAGEREIILLPLLLLLLTRRVTVKREIPLQKDRRNRIFLVSPPMMKIPPALKTKERERIFPLPKKRRRIFLLLLLPGMGVYVSSTENWPKLK